MHFKLKTSLHFPIYELTPYLSYFKVKKPSGLSYMILLFFSELKKSTIKLPKLFSNFGIPESLYGLLADEIGMLCESEVLHFKEKHYNRQNFNNYSLNQFSLTALGAEQLKKKRIPTQAKESFERKLYYSPYNKSYELSINNKLENVADSPLTSTIYIKNKEYSQASLKAFLKEQPNHIVDSNKLSKEDVLHEVKLIEAHMVTQKQIKFDFTMHIESNTAKLEFEDPQKTKFFNENYSVNTLMKAFKLMKKFNFPNRLPIHEGNLDDFNIKTIDFPNQFKLKPEKDEIAFFPETTDTQSENILPISNFNELLDQPYKKAHVFWNKEGMIAYLATRVELNLLNLDKVIQIPLSVVVDLDKNQMKKLKQTFVQSLKHYEQDIAFKMALKADDLEKNGKYLKSLFETIISSEDIHSLDTILKKYQSHLKRKAYVNTHLKSLVFNKLQTLNKEALNQSLSDINLLNDHLKVNEKVKPEEILNHYHPKNEKDTIMFFNALSQNGFNNQEVFKNLDMPKILMQAIVKKTSIDIDAQEVDPFKHFNNLFHSLVETLNIQSPHDIDSSILETNTKQHIKTLKQIEAAFDMLRPYSHYAPDEWSKLESYLRQFSSIKTNLIQINSTRNTSDSPDKALAIDLNKTSEIETVLNIAAKLEVKLKTFLKSKNKTLEKLIDEAHNKKMIDSKLHKMFHRFRQERNRVVHERKVLSISNEAIEKIIDSINELEVKT